MPPGPARRQEASCPCEQRTDQPPLGPHLPPIWNRVPEWRGRDIVGQQSTTPCLSRDAGYAAASAARLAGEEHGHGRERRGEGYPHQGEHQDAPQERSPLRVHAQHDGVPAGERAPAGAPPHHRAARLWVHAVAAGRGADAVDAAEGDGRPEHHRGRRLHRRLRARHRARHPRRRQDRRHRRQPRVLRHRPPRHREGRRRAQGRLPRGPRAEHPRRPPRRRGERGQVRLRVRGRGQGELWKLPRAAAAAGARRRRARLRQHALGRLRGDAGRRTADGGGQGDQGGHQGVQRQDRRRRARRGRAAPRRRRHHALPPRRLSLRRVSQMYVPMYLWTLAILSRSLTCFFFSKVVGAFIFSFQLA